MSLKTGQYEDEVLELVKTVCPRVFDTEVPEPGKTPAMPYVVLRWTEPVRTARDRHITSTRNDGQRGGLFLEVVSATSTSARDMKDLIKDTLTGFRPTDCGEFVAEGGIAFSRANTEPKPTSYVRGVYFSFRTNLGWVE